MPFDLGEYDDAFARFMHDALRELAIAQAPALQQIQMEETRGALGSVIQDREGNDVEIAPGAIESRMAMSGHAVRNGEVEALVSELDAGASQVADGYMRSLIATMQTVTGATGNVVSAAGRSTFDAFYEGLDRMAWSLTDDDRLSLPSLLVNPADLDKFRAFTDEQLTRIDALHERKLSELLAGRRRRRLS